MGPEAENINKHFDRKDLEKTTFKNLHKEHEEYYQEERRIDDDSKKGRGVKITKNEHADFY
jgi:hypothetical protein